MEWVTMFLENLERYSGALSFLATTVLALLTLNTVRIASKTLKEMRQTREEESRPYVVFYISKLEHDSNQYYMILENFGKTVAKDIKVSTDPAIQDYFPQSFVDQAGIYLAPRQRIVSAFHRGKNPPNLECKLEYKSDSGLIYYAKYLIDISYGSSLVWAKNEDPLIVQLKKINGTIQESVERLLEALPAPHQD